MNIGRSEYRRKVLSCWIGKNIGGTLGGPYEGFPTINTLSFYDPVPTEAMPNDDLELQAMYAAALDRMDHPEVNRETLADIWLKHMNFHCDEYAVAMKNLAAGIRPPWSGEWDNYFTCGMGAAIRSELWACLAPGNPDLAAKFAYEDACIDHADDGIYAEIFFAAAESLAFIETDVRKLIDAALTYIPADSVLAEGIRTACSQWDLLHDWRKVRDILFERYASEFKTSVFVNIPFTVLALLSGNGDFGKTICDAANCGMDTDCTAATAGALLGILDPDGIPEKWKAPVGKELVVRKTAIVDLDFPATIEAFTDQVLALRSRIPAEVKKIPVPEPDRNICRIPVRFAVHKNLYWWHVQLNEVKWTSMRCDSIFGDFAVPPEFRGNGGQIVLEFRFELPEDGQYSLMFNSPTSNQIYLDVEGNDLYDDRLMLFGRQRYWKKTVEKGKSFPDPYPTCIFNPALGGAPLNQYKRYLPLRKGVHTLYAVLEPFEDEDVIFWGLGVSVGNRFLSGIFR